MKPQRNSKSEENRAAAASLLADLEEEYSGIEPSPKMDRSIIETRGKVEPKLDLKLSQSEVKVKSKLSHVEEKHKPKLSQKVEPKSQFAGKVEPEPEPKVEPILSQSEAKVEPNLSLAALVGLQRHSLLFIYESCRMAGSKISAPVGIQNLASESGTTVAADSLARF